MSDVRANLRRHIARRTRVRLVEGALVGSFAGTAVCAACSWAIADISPLAALAGTGLGLAWAIRSRGAEVAVVQRVDEQLGTRGLLATAWELGREPGGDVELAILAMAQGHATAVRQVRLSHRRWPVWVQGLLALVAIAAAAASPQHRPAVAQKLSRLAGVGEVEYVASAMRSGELVLAGRSARFPRDESRQGESELSSPPVDSMAGNPAAGEGRGSSPGVGDASAETNVRSKPPTLSPATALPATAGTGGKGSPGGTPAGPGEKGVATDPWAHAQSVAHGEVAQGHVPADLVDVVKAYFAFRGR